MVNHAGNMQQDCSLHRNREQITTSASCNDYMDVWQFIITVSRKNANPPGLIPFL